MKTQINEIGVIDKLGNKHPVKFQKGLNVVTGKSSTGKSALIEIYDYCFGSDENTIPKGVITTNAAIYYIALSINDQDLVIARDPELHGKGFFRRLDVFNSNDIHQDYFESQYFIAIDAFKKHLRSYFLDIDDVDVSLAAREYRKNKAKAATPSIRSFSSFVLQHQNLVANKHALFYRFDQKEKRDQAIDHTKIFLGLVDQNYFHLSQEHERLTTEINQRKRQQNANMRAAESYKERIAPVLIQLYAMMGFEGTPITPQALIRNPQATKEELDKIIVPEKIDYNSDAVTKRYNELDHARTLKTAELRKLQRKASSISKHIDEESKLEDNLKGFETPEHAHISSTTCPFCHTEKEELAESAQKLKNAIIKVSGNLAHARPMRAKFESSLVEVERQIEAINNDISQLNSQIHELEKTEKRLDEKKSLYESILIAKAQLFMLLDTQNLANDVELEKEIEALSGQLRKITGKLNEYNIEAGLNNAAAKVNEYMSEIGNLFEFEASYKPIKLNFSFETFDLFHLTPEGEKIYLRSMGSGANWLYSHVTLFLALHRYFAELGERCAIPSVIFFDQPTQVYFPNFNRDNSETFEEQKTEEMEQRKRSDEERAVDEDIKAVENLFSQISMYCDKIEKENGFCPQIIITDHADGLTLSNGVSFEGLVNGNRWRKRGLIEPVPE
ncbi:DUF3732 domain-containing protein [Terasakiella pusilla]|uniref:DUF3732 domain-containing protein n=1 Tax=Terasakiella pusilla TaxID=64973 RepID=UPI003AA95FEA